MDIASDVFAAVRILMWLVSAGKWLLGRWRLQQAAARSLAAINGSGDAATVYVKLTPSGFG